MTTERELIERATILAELSYRDSGDTDTDWAAQFPHAVKEIGEASVYLVGTQAAALVVADDIVYSVWRGSDRTTDWLSNFARHSVSGPWTPYGASWHFGMSVGVQRVMGETAYVTDYAKHINGREHVLVGHSRGGGMALCAAARWHELGRPAEVVVTFGSPRVGNGRAMSLIREHLGRHYRFVNGRDPVPRLPIFGYQHDTRPYYFTAQNDMIDQSLWITQQLDRFRRWWSRKGSPAGDHSMREYADRVADHLTRFEG